MRPIPNHCEFKGGRGIRTGGGVVVECQQPARYRCPDGEVRTLLLWQQHSARYVGPCHWSATTTMAEQALANWPDFPKGYELYEPTKVEVAQEKFLQQRLRYALSETLPYRTNGLMRQDNSSAGEVDFIPTPHLRRIG